jgi:hypothetical protein
MPRKTNKLFPGLPNYIGPKRGMFGLLHHDTAIKYSHDVTERVEYVKKNKCQHELATRLRAMVYIAPRLLSAEWDKASAEYVKAYAEWAKASAKWAKARAEWAKASAKWAKARAEYVKAYAEYVKASAKWAKASAKWAKARAEHEPEINALLSRLVPDCPWDGKKMVFPNG